VYAIKVSVITVGILRGEILGYEEFRRRKNTEFLQTFLKQILQNLEFTNVKLLLWSQMQPLVNEIHLYRIDFLMPRLLSVQKSGVQILHLSWDIVYLVEEDYMNVVHFIKLNLWKRIFK
jgi:hypothetical protein